MKIVRQPIGLMLLCFNPLLLSTAYSWASLRSCNWWRRQQQPIVTIPDHFGDNGNNTTQVSHVDSHFMKLALAEATKAGKRGEVPIGALVVRPLVVVDDGMDKNSTVGNNNSQKSFFQVLSTGSNQVEERRDASAHAELLAMRKAALKNGNASWRLLNSTLYTTVEPCVMCLAAAQAFRVGRIVYGAPDLRLGAIDTYVKLLESPHPFHNIDEVVRGVHQEESAALLKAFFRKQREKKKRQGKKRNWLQKLWLRNQGDKL